jgi:hypothetical protein
MTRLLTRNEHAEHALLLSQPPQDRWAGLADGTVIINVVATDKQLIPHAMIWSETHPFPNSCGGVIHATHSGSTCVMYHSREFYLQNQQTSSGAESYYVAYEPVAKDFGHRLKAFAQAQMWKIIFRPMLPTLKANFTVPYETSANLFSPSTPEAYAIATRRQQAMHCIQFILYCIHHTPSVTNEMDDLYRANPAQANCRDLMNLLDKSPLFNKPIRLANTLISPETIKLQKMALQMDHVNGNNYSGPDLTAKLAQTKIATNQLLFQNQQDQASTKETSCCDCFTSCYESIRRCLGL